MTTSFSSRKFGTGRRQLLFAVILAAFLSACGASAKIYTAAKTRACLAAHRAKIGAVGSDLVASTATAGAFRAQIADNAATFVFSNTVAEADEVKRAYHRFAGKNVGLAAVLFQQGNVVMLWRRQPPSDLAGVTSCLK